MASYSGRKKPVILPEIDENCDWIQVVNQLQEKLASVGQPLNVSLPQIVVVGSQSAGKTSVLESVVGKEFLPRGKGTVTRRPTVIQLQPSNEEYATFSHLPNKKYTDFQEVKKEIEMETNRVLSAGKVGFSSSPIFLRIYSPNVLKLTLVDLPGLINVAVDNEPESSVEEVRQMVLEYIRPEKALILAVCAANNDIATFEALKIAKEVDPDRVRTIGVLTKLDKMDAGTDARDILENKIVYLERGYVGVVNRSQADIEAGRDLNYGLENEKKFFENNPYYRHLADKMGGRYLQKMLHIQLTEHIKETLPLTCQELRQKRASIQKELKDLEILGYSTTGSNGVQTFMITLIQKFISQFETDILGFSSKVPMNELSSGTMINYRLFTHVQKNLSLPSIPDQQQLMKVITNIHGVRNWWSIPSLSLDAVAYHLLAEYIEPLNNCVDSVANLFHTCVEKTSMSLKQYPKLRNELLQLIRKSIDESTLETKEMLFKHIEAQRFFPNIHHPDFVFPTTKTSETISPINLGSGDTFIEASDTPSSEDTSSSDSGIVSSYEQAESITAETDNIMNALTSNKTAQDNANLLADLVAKYLTIQHKQISDTAIKYIAFFLVNGVMIYIKAGLISAILGSYNSKMLLDDVARDLEKVKKLQEISTSLNDALITVQNFP